MKKKGSMFKNQVLSATENKAEKTGEYFKYASQNGFSMITNDLIEQGHMSKMGSRLITFIVLLKCANTETFQCNPSNEKLSELTGKDERQIQRDTKWLHENGYIMKCESKSINKKTGNQYSNNYVITAHELCSNYKEPVETKKITLDPTQEVKEVENALKVCVNTNDITTTPEVQEPVKTSPFSKPVKDSAAPKKALPFSLPKQEVTAVPERRIKLGSDGMPVLRAGKEILIDENGQEIQN